MTDIQKHEIMVLRKQGFSYSEIAAKIGVNVNSIKTHCQRNGLGQKDLAEMIVLSKTTHFCKQCGDPLVILPKMKPKMFCNATCRSTWWNAHPEEMSSSPDYYSVCACCGKEFHNRGGKNRVYCSHDCYIKARFGKASTGEKEETAKPIPKSMKKPAPQFVDTPQSDSCMSKKQSDDELAYRLIKIMLDGMVLDEIISQGECETIREKAIQEIAPLIGSL
jgi:DNA-directed RNA polymerase specialized sigma subunit, sigma24 homolog